MYVLAIIIDCLVVVGQPPSPWQRTIQDHNQSYVNDFFSVGNDQIEVSRHIAVVGILALTSET